MGKRGAVPVLSGCKSLSRRSSYCLPPQPAFRPDISRLARNGPPSHVTRRNEQTLAPAPGTIVQPVQPVQRKAPDPAVHREARDPQLPGDALLG